MPVAIVLTAANVEKLPSYFSKRCQSTPHGKPLQVTACDVYMPGVDFLTTSCHLIQHIIAGILVMIYWFRFYIITLIGDCIGINIRLCIIGQTAHTAHIAASRIYVYAHSGKIPFKLFKLPFVAVGITQWNYYEIAVATHRQAYISYLWQFGQFGFDVCPIVDMQVVLPVDVDADKA